MRSFWQLGWYTCRGRGGPDERDDVWGAGIEFGYSALRVLCSPEYRKNIHHHHHYHSHHHPPSIITYIGPRHHHHPSSDVDRSGVNWLSKYRRSESVMFFLSTETCLETASGISSYGSCSVAFDFPDDICSTTRGPQSKHAEPLASSSALAKLQRE